jgi:hypothetical protein
VSSRRHDYPLDAMQHWPALADWPSLLAENVQSSRGGERCGTRQFSLTVVGLSYSAWCGSAEP